MSGERASKSRPHPIGLWRVLAIATAVTGGGMFLACQACPDHGLSPRYTFTEILTFETTHPSPYAVDDGEIEASAEEIVVTYRSPDGSLWQATYVASDN